MCVEDRVAVAQSHWLRGSADDLRRGRETHDVRYDMLSRYLSGQRFAEAVRGHWSIESMHWVLDVIFREDDCRTRERTLGEQRGQVRMALSFA